MRVSIEHKVKKTGLIRRTTHYVVFCKVDFSEEEKQIIKRRNLGGWKVMDRTLGSNIDLKKADEAGLTNLNIQINELMKKKPDSYYCSTPAEAKTYEDDLTEALKTMKQFIDNHTEVGQKVTTFEL